MGTGNSRVGQKPQGLVAELRETQLECSKRGNGDLVGKLPSPADLPRISGLSFVFFFQPPPQPFLEMEELRLARQLEGLWAKLALGTKEHVIPQRSSEVQEEGKGAGR